VSRSVGPTESTAGRSTDGWPAAAISGPRSPPGPTLEQRNRRRLDRAHEIIRELQLEIGRFYARSELSDSLISLRNGIQTALAVLLAAIESRESRGCDYRTD
jgi:hypothetical protein